MKISEWQQAKAHMTRPGTPEQKKKAEENNKKYLADRKAKTLKEYGLEKPLIDPKHFVEVSNKYDGTNYVVDGGGNITTETDLIKKFDNNDPTTYPSNPEQRKKLMAQEKLKVLKRGLRTVVYDGSKDEHKPIEKKKPTITTLNIPIPTIDPIIYNRSMGQDQKAPTPKPITRNYTIEDDPKYRGTIFGSDVYYRRKRGLDD